MYSIIYWMRLVMLCGIRRLFKYAHIHDSLDVPFDTVTYIHYLNTFAYSWMHLVMLWHMYLI